MCLSKDLFFTFICIFPDRGSYGGCFATTLGALIHELGHSLDLGHTENGIMARGFDDMDRFFTVCPNEKKSDHLIRRNSLRFCGAVPKLTSTQEKSMRSGGVRRKENGSNILEEYQKRKYYRKMVQDCGGAYWSRSCALILSNHRSVELLRNYRNYIMVEKVTIDWTIADECFSTL